MLECLVILMKPLQLIIQMMLLIEIVELSLKFAKCSPHSSLVPVDYILLIKELFGELENSHTFRFIFY